MKEPVFIAHRGAPLPARRENSNPAFERAATSNRFAYIHLNVRRTRSDDQGQRTPIVSYGEETTKLYDSQRVPKYRRTYSGLKLDSLTYDMLRADALEISTLAEVLRTLKGHPVIIDIEDSEVLPDTVDIVRDFINQSTSRWRLDSFVIASKSREQLEHARRLEPFVQLGAILSLRTIFNRELTKILKLQPTFVLFSWKLFLVAPMLAILKIKKRYAYSLNQPWQIRFLRLFAVNGFYTKHISLPDSFLLPKKD